MVLTGCCWFKHVCRIYAERAQIFFHFLRQLWFSRRTKCDSHHRQRPSSEGPLRYPEPREDERNVGKGGTGGRRWTTVEADAWGDGRDLPSLLQEVSLKGSRDSSLVSSDGTRMPWRRVNLFLSLKLRNQGASKSEGRGHEMQKEMGTLLSNIRNEGERGSSSHLPVNNHTVQCFGC